MLGIKQSILSQIQILTAYLEQSKKRTLKVFEYHMLRYYVEAVVEMYPSYKVSKVTGQNVPINGLHREVKIYPMESIQVRLRIYSMIMYNYNN